VFFHGGVSLLTGIAQYKHCAADAPTKIKSSLTTTEVCCPRQVRATQEQSSVPVAKRHHHVACKIVLFEAHSKLWLHPLPTIHVTTFTLLLAQLCNQGVPCGDSGNFIFYLVCQLPRKTKQNIVDAYIYTESHKSEKIQKTLI
jgi:hypothetical protein